MAPFGAFGCSRVLCDVVVERVFKLLTAHIVPAHGRSVELQPRIGIWLHPPWDDGQSRGTGTQNTGIVRSGVVGTRAASKTARQQQSSSRVAHLHA